MKKNYKALALLIAVLFSSATIGCKANIEVEEHDDPNGGINIEVKSDSNSNVEVDEDSNKENSNIEIEDKDETKVTSNKTSNTEIKDVIFDKVDSREMYKATEHVYVIYERHLYDQGDTYSVLTGYGHGDKKIWEYKTKIVPDYQFPRYTFLNGYLDNAFLKDGKDIKVFNIKTGKIEATIKGMDLNNMDYLDDYNGKLYFAASKGILSINQIVVVNPKTYTIEKKFELPEKYNNYEYVIYIDKTGAKYIDLIDSNNKIERVSLDYDKLLAFGCKEI